VAALELRRWENRNAVSPPLMPEDLPLPAEEKDDSCCADCPSHWGLPAEVNGGISAWVTEDFHLPGKEVVDSSVATLAPTIQTQWISCTELVNDAAASSE